MMVAMRRRTLPSRLSADAVRSRWTPLAAISHRRRAKTECYQPWNKGFRVGVRLIQCMP
jgi:hypothetical protein